MKAKSTICWRTWEFRRTRGRLCSYVDPRTHDIIGSQDLKRVIRAAARSSITACGCFSPRYHEGVSRDNLSAAPLVILRFKLLTWESTSRSLSCLCAESFSSVFHYPKLVSLVCLCYRRAGNELDLSWPPVSPMEDLKKAVIFTVTRVHMPDLLLQRTHPNFEERAPCPGFVSAVKAAFCKYSFVWLSHRLRTNHQSRAGLVFVLHLVDKSRRTFMGKSLRPLSSWNWKWRCCWRMQEPTYPRDDNGSVLNSNSLQGAL